MRTLYSLLPFACLVLVFPSLAQDLTVKEGAEISYQAKRLVSEYQNLLNTVTNADMGEADTKFIIENSFTDPANKIFYNAEVNIEDDVDPRIEKGKDFPVSKYLNNLDLMYTKSQINSIVFDKITASNVKKKDFYYIKVFFESTFNNRHRKYDTPYKTTKRVAIVRADKEGRKWKTQIVGISFAKPEDPKTAAQNDIKLVSEPDEQVTAEASGTADSEAYQQRLAEMVVAQSKAMLQKQEEENENEYAQALKSAKEAEALQDYVTALDHYKIARDLFKRTDVVKKVLEIERIIEARNNWKLMKENGDLAASLRNYGKAVDLYNQSLRVNPNQPELVGKIKELTLKIEEVSLPKNLYDQHKYEEALKECNRKIKKNKNSIPELYLIRGLCYIKLKDDKNAQEEFTQAINIDRNYLEARLARAELAQRKNDLANAITDLDAITQSIAPNDPAYHAQKATLKVLANNRKSAIADYEKAIGLSPKTPQYHYEKAVLHYAEGENEKALESYDRAIQLDANYTAAYFERGRTYIRLNRVPDAARDFFKAKKGGLDDNSLKAIGQISHNYYLYGRDSFGNKKYQQAIAHFNNALTIQPDYAEASFAKGEAYYELKDYESAKGDYSQAIDVNAKYAEAYYKRGAASYQLNEDALALEDFKKATTLKSDFYDAFMGKGNTEMRLKNFNNAVFDLQMAINLMLQRLKSADSAEKTAIEGKLADAYNGLGRSKYETKNYAGAVAELKNALKYNRNHADALYNRGLAYAELNDPKSAIEDYTACLALAPKRYEVAYARAMAYDRSEKYDKAAADYTLASNTDTLKTMEDVIYRRGVSYTKLKSYDLALKDYETYTQANPSKLDSKLYSEMGFLYLNKNQFEKANENFSQAFQLDNKNVQAMYGMGFGFAQMNGAEKALEWLEKALQTDKEAWNNLKQDEYLANLKSDKAFKSLKNKYKLK